MKVIESVSEMRFYRNTLKKNSIGFVPTMGALHNGHLSLFERSKQECAHTIISIFVNPTQFNDPKDLEKYPRPIEQDLKLAASAGVDVVFLPSPEEIYADQYRYQVGENRLSQILCGAARPGHFEGVLTIVLKLFNITQPTYAYFGEKDFQQFLLIRDMAKALFLPTEVRSHKTLREDDGLALSSRNRRMTEEQRALAPLLFQELSSEKSLREVRAILERAGFKIDYLEEHFGRRFVAAFLGDVRLIDNV
jgi:pantoate--beta-alanine ligase